MTNWQKDSWRSKKSDQIPDYENQEALVNIVKKIESYPPLVFPGEVENLKNQIAQAQDNKKFILQAGDCVERFDDCNRESIVNKMKIILQMSLLLTYSSRKPVVKIGRIAGQYAKPRSKKSEIINDKEMLSFKGESIHGFGADVENRKPDPNRLLQSYFHSGVTLNYIRAMIEGGFANMQHPFHWNLHGIRNTEKWMEYKEILEDIVKGIQFMEVFNGVNTERLEKIDFFTSHEGLHLNYEEAMTRKDIQSDICYNLSAHMIWIGERTRELNGAHVEYFKGIANPIGIKIGPSIKEEELIELIKILNPRNLKGKMIIISRMGAQKAKERLPQLIQSVNKAKFNITWISDPMHANTFATKDNIKTRNVEDIKKEIAQTFVAHNQNDSHLAGLHLELTGDDVTECTGGLIDIQHKDLNLNYQSYCDPRLNYAQSLEIAFFMSNYLKL